jgi:predicted aconitase with swiveling domain
MARSGGETATSNLRGGAPAQQTGRTLAGGDAVGPVLRLDEPVSFWGGVDASGAVIDVHHPQHGQSLAGAVLVMAEGRGSSSATAVLAEQIRVGAAPAALVLGSCDTILVIGALVAAELYGVRMPVVQVDPADLERIGPGTVRVHADDATGRALVQPTADPPSIPPSNPPTGPAATREERR